MREVLSASIPMGQLFGIAIRVHIVMPLFMIGVIGHAMKTDTVPGSWIDATILMVMIFFCVLLHEFGHCFAARYVDGEADEVLLWPLGGLAYCRSLPHTPIAHFIVAAGGPLVNLALCTLCALALAFALDQSYQAPFNPIWRPYRWKESGEMAIALWGGDPVLSGNPLALNLSRFFWVNWVQFLFNVVLIGVPFDGGRMLQAALWPRLGHYQASKLAVYSGFGIMIIIGVASIILGEPLLAYLTIFIFMTCAQELHALETSHEESLFGYDFSQGYTSLEKDEAPPPPEKKQNFIQRWLAERAARKEQQEREQREAEDKRMDELLEKIQKFGKDSLTDEEQRFLKRVSDRYKNRQ